MEMTPFLFGLYSLVKYMTYPLTWVIISVAVTLTVALFPLSPSRHRWIRWSAICSITMLIVFTNPLVAFLLLGTLETWHPPGPITKNVDAIVVLGGGIQDQGTLRPRVELTETSQYRTFCGTELYKQGRSSLLVVSGGDARVDRHGPILASAMKAWAVQYGVPVSAIVEEARSRTTYENAVESKRILGANASILLVTTAYHLPRAVGLFTKQGFVVTPAPCGFQYGNRPFDGQSGRLDPFDFLPSIEAFDHITKATGEIIGICVYWVNGKL